MAKVINKEKVLEIAKYNCLIIAAGLWSILLVILGKGVDSDGDRQFLIFFSFSFPLIAYFITIYTTIRKDSKVDFWKNFVIAIIGFVVGFLALVLYIYSVYSPAAKVLGISTVIINLVHLFVDKDDV